MGRPRIYSDIERKEKERESRRKYMKKWRMTHQDKVKEQNKKNYLLNRENNINRVKKWKEDNPNWQKEYRLTKIGRAFELLGSYRVSDEKHQRGECTITAQWIVDNIFSKSCHYCGENDWKQLGCDRIDNSKPHTEENCIPCCMECNRKRGRKSYDDFMKNEALP